MYTNNVPGTNKQHIFALKTDRKQKEFKITAEENLESEYISTGINIPHLKNEILAAKSLERISNEKKKKEITLTLNFTTKLQLSKEKENFRELKGVFDSGASINCIDRKYAMQYYRKQIKSTRDFDVTTANGQIIINKYLPLRIRTFIKNPKTKNLQIKDIITRFYLLPRSPYKWIISRGLFHTLGYTILDPSGNVFTNKAHQEKLSGDLYEEFYKHMDYPLNEKEMKTEQKEFLNYIKENGHLFGDNEIQMRNENNHSEEHICHIDSDRKGKESFKNTANVGKIQFEIIRNDFSKLINSNKDRYAKHAGDMGTIPGELFRIRLKAGATPYASKGYPQSFKHSDIIRKQCQQLFENKIIRFAESEWAAPVLLVPKPTRDGIEEWRMCIDYRHLNKVTEKDKYKVISVRDLYRKLTGNKIFSSIDLRSGYYHIEIAEEDKYKTAFITDEGRTYEWNRMCFGFTNAPAVFQRTMDKIFGDLDFVIVYIDDIIICSKTEKEHIGHLKKIFERLKKYNLKLRLEKCEFFQKQLKYLGILVDEIGIRPDPKYIGKVLKFKKPNDGPKAVERFIGMVSWLRRFIPNLSKLTSPISELKNKTQAEFEWTNEHDIYFEAIIKAISNAKVLRHPDLNRRFFIQTDASNKAIGAVLLQDFGNGYLEPIEFISRKFITAEQNWHASEKELVAIVWALKKWIRYLLPMEFTVFTDHKNLEVLFNKNSKKYGKLQRWIIFLQQFDFIAKYIPGKDNYIADYLSRDVEKVILLNNQVITISKEQLENEIPQILTTRNNNYIKTKIKWKEDTLLIPLRRSPRIREKHQKEGRTYLGDEIYDEKDDFKNYGKKIIIKEDELTIPHFKSILENNENIKNLKEENWDEIINSDIIKKEQYKDKEIKIIIKQIQDRNQKKELYKLNHEGIVFMRNNDNQYKCLIPSSMKENIMRYYHTSNNFHHQGRDRTQKNILEYFIWKNLYDDVRQFTQDCHVCNLANGKSEGPNAGKRTPILCNKFNQLISVDIVGSLPTTSSENRYLLTIMDRFTRYVKAIPLKNITAATVSQALLNEWYYIYGTPDTILADNGTQFTNIIFKIINETLGIKTKYAPPYYPKGNGMIERFHRFLKQKLAIKAETLNLDFIKYDDWDIFIPSICYAFNASNNPNIDNYSPYEILYGNKVKLTIQIPSIKDEEVTNVKNYEEYLFNFIKQLEIIRNKVFMKEYEIYIKRLKDWNKKTKDFTYKIGDLVTLKLHRKGNVGKLSLGRKGPYEIMEIIGTNENKFRIQNIDNTTEEHIVHGSDLAKYNKKVERNIQEEDIIGYLHINEIINHMENL